MTHTDNAPDMTATTSDAEAISNLLFWYDKAGRHLPWRHRWPDLAPAYHVFLSELMLQQTTVPTVIPYFLRFTERWPTILDMAQSPTEEITAAWAGLGYYARARNMHKAAQVIAFDLNGVFPDTEEGLLALPGIGPYSAGAIRAFAFDQPSIVLDGNIERVLARYFGLKTPLPKLKTELKARYPALIPPTRRSDFPQALMDLGGQICTPKKTACDLCPLSLSCVSAWSDEALRLPVKAPKKAKPKRQGSAFVASWQAPDGGHYIALMRRPDKGLLGGMQAFPSTGWDKSLELAPAYQAFFDEWAPVPAGTIQHVFTHFEARLSVRTAHIISEAKPELPMGLSWVAISDAALPTLMAKVLKQAVSAEKDPQNTLL
ncbi:MAG: A/G-specific adenine glycosylase [Candidatus Puniceispirillaceae bacterium]